MYIALILYRLLVMVKKIKRSYQHFLFILFNLFNYQRICSDWSPITLIENGRKWKPFRRVPHLPTLRLGWQIKIRFFKTSTSDAQNECEST